MRRFKLVAMTMLGAIVLVAAPSWAGVDRLVLPRAAAESISPHAPHMAPGVVQVAAAAKTASPGGAGGRRAARGSGGSRPGFVAPPRGERRFVADEVVLSTQPNVSADTLTAIAQRNRLTRMESQDSALTGLRFYRWRIDTGASVAATIRSLVRENLIVSAQPNYIYRLQQDRAAEPPSRAQQYSLGMLRVLQAQRLAMGNDVLVAVIDSEIEVSHPEIMGSVAARFDTTSVQVPPEKHGTAMAGAIAAHRQLTGVAPRASLLAVRAFGGTEAGDDGTTFRILKGLSWAATQNARVINMSFAGPDDLAVHDALAAAHRRGIVLVAAAGNAGPRSPPLYPAADPNVIAVTAIDAEGGLFPYANRGKHVAIAAPGVDVLVPAPGGAYGLTSGTSVAAAEVSGVVALMLERVPSLSPDDVRKILMGTAQHLGAKGQNPDFGAGLADAVRALEFTLSAAPAAASH